MTVNIWLLIISIIFGYLIGSVSFANIIVKKIKGEDINEIGSGNAGTTNVFRTAGFFPAIITFVLDMLKGSVAVLLPLLLAKLFKESYPAIYMMVGGVLAILGHMFPVFFGFKGGKGMATFLGIILAINPLVFLINISFMLVVILITRMVSIASISSAVLIPILTIFLNKHSILKEQNIYFVLTTILIGLFILFKHRENIARIKEGKENKINLKKD